MAILLSEPPEIEFEGASPAAVEEVALACAEEIERWAKRHEVHDQLAALQAIELARALRVAGWMITVVEPGEFAERASVIDRVEGLAARAALLVGDEPSIRESVRPPVVSEPPPWSDERPAVRVAKLEFEDEPTINRKAKWDETRPSTNRLLGLRIKK